MVEFKEIDFKENERNIIAFLDAHQTEATGVEQAIPTHFSIGAYDGTKYIGGITANNWMNTTHISLLAVDTEYRKDGLGSNLLIQAENYAKSQNAEIITIHTQDYQAKTFYEKHSYHVLGKLPNSPFKGTTKYYLAKQL
ncbi:GNAT family N-acetyltransferase [Enterococcus sp. CWB-B31]|uniref:GNAT family N-acetyltransferase n=1 Tax=Enterococcus sp. CWB-B31 TaxID=2885159 RepID=UPI001E32362F|nr:GNAT family N-acetyltransferase [Enterococcus sp. CWB-B31]MCB5955411.1 GNAT family N-acetyltransferase [Enterococcus sp. CWB-B31]